MKKYVLGFLFDGAGSVVLIKKNRPAWQAGLLNGPGGHIKDGEMPKDAMVREFMEETGVDVPAEKWRFFAILNGQTDGDGEDFEVHCFTCRRTANLKQMTDEAVNWYSVNAAGDPSLVPGLSWLIPMANDMNSPRMFVVADRTWK